MAWFLGRGTKRVQLETLTLMRKNAAKFYAKNNQQIKQLQAITLDEKQKWSTVDTGGTL